MQTSKKKPSVIFLAFGALLAAYLGYLVGGAWEQGIDLMSFMERFNSVCAAPFANYFNENSGTDAGLVTKESSSVDSKIIKKLDKFTKDGIYAKAIKTSESKYAIVWVYNTDKSNLKDEIKESLTSISNFSTKCETSYLRK